MAQFAFRHDPREWVPDTRHSQGREWYPSPTSDVHGVGAMSESLQQEWTNSTMFESSMTKRVMHPAYQRIIGLGPKVLPIILEELRRQSDQWFWALSSITGANPVPPDAAGNLRRMTDAWVERALHRSASLGRRAMTNDGGGRNQRR